MITLHETSNEGKNRPIWINPSNIDRIELSNFEGSGCYVFCGLRAIWVEETPEMILDLIRTEREFLIANTELVRLETIERHIEHHKAMVIPVGKTEEKLEDTEPKSKESLWSDGWQRGWCKGFKYGLESSTLTAEEIKRKYGKMFIIDGIDHSKDILKGFKSPDSETKTE